MVALNQGYKWSRISFKGRIVIRLKLSSRYQGPFFGYKRNKTRYKNMQRED